MPLPEEQFYTEEDYWNLPEDVLAELIDGRLYYMTSPSRIHQEISSVLHGLIFQYIRPKKGSCRVYHAPFAVKLRKDRDNTVEPDLAVICDRSRLTDRGCTGAPDWIIEIVSPGNPGQDYVRKLNLYADAGVREYWIIDPSEKSVLVYIHNQKRFQVTPYTFEDNIKVGIFDDFTIDFTEVMSDIPMDE